MDDVVLQMWCAVLVSSVFSSFFSIDFIILGHGKCYWNLDCISLNFFLFVYLLLFQKKNNDVCTHMDSAEQFISFISTATVASFYKKIFQ